MFGATYFVQHCPVCGRCLQVRIELLGKTVSCQHCHGKFKACDPALARLQPVPETEDLLDRANDLLSSVDLQRPRPR
jgi:hypothetical protein